MHLRYCSVVVAEVVSLTDDDGSGEVGEDFAGSMITVRVEVLVSPF